MATQDITLVGDSAVTNTATAKRWDSEAGPLISDDLTPESSLAVHFRRLVVRTSDPGTRSITMIFGRTQTWPTGQQNDDLSNAWENNEGALIFTQGALSVSVAGPNYSGNSIQDSGETYNWRPPESDHDALIDFLFTDADLSQDIVVTLSDESSGPVSNIAMSTTLGDPTISMSATVIDPPQSIAMSIELGDPTVSMRATTITPVIEQIAMSIEIGDPTISMRAITTAPNTIPGIPTGLTLGSLTQSSIRASWTAPTFTGNSDIESYTVRYREDGTSDIWQTLSTTDTEVTISSLDHSTSYEVQVRAHNAVDHSDYTASQTASTTAASTSPPSVPTNVTDSDVSESEITISWDAATGADFYRIRWKREDSEYWTVVDTTNSEYILSNLVGGTTYEFQVRAGSSVGLSAYSMSQTQKTDTGSAGTEFTFTIGGDDYLESLVYKSLSITESRHANGSQMNCTLDVPFGLEIPETGSSIIFTYKGEREFAGRVADVTQEQVGVGKLLYHLNCIDWTADFDATLLQPEELPEQNAGQMVRDIIGRIGRGFVVGDVDDGPIHQTVQLDLDTPSSVIDNIAQATQRQWFIDYYRTVHFVSIDTERSPLSGNILDIDMTVDDYDSLTYEVDWSQVKNKLYIVDAELRGGPDQIREIPDGDIGFIPLRWEPWNSEIDVVVDGIPQEILIDGEDGEVGDGQGEEGQCYLCIGNWGVRFPDNHRVPAGAEVEIVYPVVLTRHVTVQNQQSIDLMKSIEDSPESPSDGIHEMKFSAPNLRLENLDALIEYAQGVLDRYAFPEHITKFRSTRQGWRSSQQFRVFSRSQRRNINQRVYVRRVQKSIWTPVSVTGHQAPSLQYEIEASTSPYHT